MAQASSTATVALFGAGGYAGQVLARLITAHPRAEAVRVDGRSPSELDPEAWKVLSRADAVALALPSEASRIFVPALLERTAAKIVDLSDAYRCADRVRYGLPELVPPPTPGERIVANPGCYPTAALCALLPLLRAGAIADGPVAVVGKSGASGAGKGTAPHLHFCELAENTFPYKVGEHRHVPEIERHLGTEVCFVTELLPVVRGLSVTCFVRPRDATSADLRAVLERAYAEAPYVHVLDAPDGRLGIRHVVGTHDVRLAVGPRSRAGLVPVFAAIDNLMRGAASQALVNLNRLLGFDDHLGLPPPVRPAGPLPGMKGTWT